MSFMHKICTELKISHSIFAEIANNFFDAFRDAIASCLADAQNQGELSKEKDTTMLANFILYLWHGVLLHTADHDDEDAINEFCNILERDLLGQTHPISVS